MIQKQTHIQNRLVVSQRTGWWEREELGTLDWQMQTTIYRMDKQQGPTIYQGPTVYHSISCDKP